MDHNIAYLGPKIVAQSIKYHLAFIKTIKWSVITWGKPTNLKSCLQNQTLTLTRKYEDEDIGSLFPKLKHHKLSHRQIWSMHFIQKLLSILAALKQMPNTLNCDLVRKNLETN